MLTLLPTPPPRPEPVRTPLQPTKEATHERFRRKLDNRRVGKQPTGALPPELQQWVNEVRRLHDELEDLRESSRFLQSWLTKLTKLLQRAGLAKGRLEDLEDLDT